MVKVTSLSKLIYRFSAIQKEIPSVFLMAADKLTGHESADDQPLRNEKEGLIGLPRWK